VARGSALLATPTYRRLATLLLVLDDRAAFALTTKQPLLQVSNAPAGVLQVAPQGLLTLLGRFTLAL
jgi:hypothetical protein